MFDNFKTKTTEANKALLEANARADVLLDPVAAKVVASRYTVVYIVLAAVLSFSAGFVAGQYF